MRCDQMRPWVTDQMKFGQIDFAGDAPMAFTLHGDGEPAKELPRDIRDATDAVGACMKAYLCATQSLMADKYSGISEFAPEYLAHP